MTVPDLALWRPPSIDLRRLLRRPELAAASVVGLAWLVLLVLDVRGSRSGDTAPGAMPGMPGMPAAGSGWSAIVSAVPYTMIMTVAMMGPAALAGIRHTGLNSLRWRRRRAMTEYASAYLAVWLGYQLALLAAVAVLPRAPGSRALCLALFAAAAWQFSPLKRRWLRDCHLSVPLPPRGWRAERAALRFGMRNGRSCLGSCWCLMLVMAVAPSGQLWWSLALSGLATTERLLERPRRATRLAGVALGTAGIWALTWQLISV